MKLIKSAAGYKLSLSVNDWKNIGKKQGWFKGSQFSMEEDAGATGGLSQTQQQVIEQVKQLLQQNGLTVEDLQSGGLEQTSAESDLPVSGGHLPDENEHEIAAPLRGQFASSKKQTK